MPKYLIDVDDIKAAHWHTRKDLKKMFANAKEAVEIPHRRIDTVGDNCYLPAGQPVTLYAVSKDAKNGKAAD